MSIIVDLTSAYQWIAWVIHFSEQMYKITYHMHCMYVQMTNQSSANFVRLVLTHILYFYFHLQEIYTPEHSSRTCMGVFICFQTWSWNRTKLEQGGQNYFSVQIKHFAVHFTPHCHYNQNICMLFTRMSCCKASDIYTSVDAHPGTILPILLYSNCFVQILKLCRVVSKKKNVMFQVHRIVSPDVIVDLWPPEVTGLSPGLQEGLNQQSETTQTCKIKDLL